MSIDEFGQWPLQWQLTAARAVSGLPEVQKLIHRLPRRSPEFARLMAMVLVTPETVEEFFAGDETISRELH